MITNNFLQALYNIKNGASYTKIDGTAVSLTTYGYEIWQQAMAVASSLPIGNQTSKLMLGTGTTTPSKSDYCLASAVDESDFSISASSKSQTSDKKIVLTQTYQYNGSGEITINEIGLVVQVNLMGAGQPLLMARVVLDSPITVHNGDTFTVSMVIG